MELKNMSALIDQCFPLAKTCTHTKKVESLETEIDDDRYNYIIVERCENCNFPMGDRYATDEEIERLENGNQTR
jgi:hypothetical protein